MNYFCWLFLLKIIIEISLLNSSTYKISFKKHPTYCVMYAFETAGFKNTLNEDWNAFWGKGIF